MRFKIYYITGTRNTKRAAKLIQLQLRSMNHECTIINWIHNDFDCYDEIDAIGFASPVHYLREPTPFRSKLKELTKFESEEKIPAFIIACCEANLGAFFNRIAKVLDKKNFNIIGTYTYYAPSNFLMFSKLFERSPKEQDPISHSGERNCPMDRKACKSKRCSRPDHRRCTSIIGERRVCRVQNS